MVNDSHSRSSVSETMMGKQKMRILLSIYSMAIYISCVLTSQNGSKWNQYIYGKYQNTNANFHILEIDQKHKNTFLTLALCQHYKTKPNAYTYHLHSSCFLLKCYADKLLELSPWHAQEYCIIHTFHKQNVDVKFMICKNTSTEPLKFVQKIIKLDSLLLK